MSVSSKLSIITCVHPLESMLMRPSLPAMGKRDAEIDAIPVDGPVALVPGTSWTATLMRADVFALIVVHCAVTMPAAVQFAVCLKKRFLAMEP